MDSFERFLETIVRSSFKGFGKFTDPGFARSAADQYYENPNRTDLYNYLRKIFMQVRGMITIGIKSIPKELSHLILRNQQGIWEEQIGMIDKIVSNFAKIIKNQDTDNFNVLLYKTAGFVSSIVELANETIADLSRQNAEEFPEFQQGIAKFKELKDYIRSSGVVRFLHSVSED